MAEMSLGTAIRELATLLREPSKPSYDTTTFLEAVQLARIIRDAAKEELGDEPFHSRDRAEITRRETFSRLRATTEKIYTALKANQPVDGEWIATLDWASRRFACGPGEVRGPIRLSDAEKDIWNVISDAGYRLTQAEIFTALSNQGKMPSEGTTKITLAAMVRHGILTNIGGYGLPEWADS